MKFTTITETNFSVFRLVQGGASYWLQKFDDHGLEQMELSEAELVTLLAALPVDLLRKATAVAHRKVNAERRAHEVPQELYSLCDNNPFFHVGEE